MNAKRDIENAVAGHFKLDVEVIYRPYKAEYPVDGAKRALIYLLYKHGHKAYDIANWFGVNTTVIYRYCGKVQVAMKSDTKIKEDIETIENQLNK